jgi:hypothetical protein
LSDPLTRTTLKTVPDPVVAVSQAFRYLGAFGKSCEGRRLADNLANDGRARNDEYNVAGDFSLPFESRLSFCPNISDYSLSNVDGTSTYRLCGADRVICGLHDAIRGLGRVQRYVPDSRPDTARQGSETDYGVNHGFSFANQYLTNPGPVTFLLRRTGLRSNEVAAFRRRVGRGLSVVEAVRGGGLGGRTWFGAGRGCRRGPVPEPLAAAVPGLSALVPEELVDGLGKGSGTEKQVHRPV